LAIDFVELGLEKSEILVVNRYLIFGHIDVIIGMRQSVSEEQKEKTKFWEASGSLARKLHSADVSQGPVFLGLRSESRSLDRAKAVAGAGPTRPLLHLSASHNSPDVAVLTS
jgi:hypothetical protein